MGRMGDIMNVRFSFIFLACLILGISVQGQVIEIDNGERESFSSSHDFGATNLHIGVANSDNGLHLLEGVQIFAGSTYVGLSAVSSNNVLELKANSQLSLGWLDSELMVGLDSSSNSLRIVDGAKAFSRAGAAVGSGISADRNDALVEGAGSEWRTWGNLLVGQSGSENSLRVLDGGHVGASTLVVGNTGSSNRMDITNGGRVSSQNGWVGAWGSATGNVVTVSGLNSEWAASDLHIGATNNSGNQVAVSNDARIVLEGGLFIEGTGNEFNLNDGGHLAVGTNFNAAMTGFNFNEGGHLSVGGSLTGMTSSVEGHRTLGIAGSLGEWNQSGSNIVVGGASSTNALYAEQGGQIFAENIFVGSVSNEGNSVSVSLGGKISVGKSIQISGTNNAFNLADGGWLVVSNDFDTSQQGFNFLSGGTLETTGSLTGMTNSLGGQSIVLTGSSAEWDLGTNTLRLDSSSIYLSAGASLANSNAVFASSNQVYVDGAGSEWTNAGSVAIGGDTNNLWVTDGGQVFNTDASIGSSGDWNQVNVSGSNSLWAVSGALTVGTNGSYNNLTITNGGYVDSISGAIGFGGVENYVLVTGTDSLWTNSGSVTVDGAGNRLQVASEGRVSVGRTLSLSNAAELEFSSGGHASASNYYQDATSTFSFDSVTNTAVDPVTELLAVEGSTEFEAGAILKYTGAIDVLNTAVVYTNLLVTSDTLIVDGITNAVAGLTADPAGLLLGMDFFSISNNLFAQIKLESLTTAAGFEIGSEMARLSGEINALALAGDPTAANQLDLINQSISDGATLNARLSQLYDRNAPTYEHVGGMLEGFKQTRQRGVMPETMWPIGARGPHLYGDQVQGWIKGYGSWGNRDGFSDSSGYDQTIHGMVVGVDKAFGDLLAGLAGGQVSSDISQDDGDESTADTRYGLLYASWGTSAWFGDLNLGYGHSSIDTQSGTLFDATSQFNADQLACYIGGGKEMVFRNDQLFVTPSAGLLGAYFAQEKYTEKATTAVPRDVEAYDRWSMQSELGLKVSFQCEHDGFVLMPETHASWLHEFNSDEQEVDYSLAGGTGNYTFGMQAPIENLFEVGLGLALWTETKERVVVEWALGLDARFGDGYSASALNARLRCEF